MLNVFQLSTTALLKNSNEIKEKLINEGFEFLSDTDSEVFVRLLEKELPTSKSFKEGIFKTFNQLSGNSAFVILDQAKGRLFAIRNNAPLVCGVDDRGTNKLVSSDAYALGEIQTQSTFLIMGFCVNYKKSKKTFYSLMNL